ncbi:MAG: T9SS type A sorting domain-containing protein [Fibrobacterota bacterium]
MFKAMLFTLLLAVVGNTTDITFNDYSDDATPGDRSSTTMYNRHVVAGNLRCKVPNVPATEYNHLCSPGQYSYDGRRICSYYWNHGIQEFAQAGNSSANVTEAYIWGHLLGYGNAPTTTQFGVSAGAAVMYIDSESATEPVWDHSTQPMYYEVIDAAFRSSLNAGTYTPSDEIKVWKYDSVSNAIAGGQAYKVTNAVKYIMDHADEDSLGILLKSTSGEGQFGMPSEENGTVGYGFYTLLTIVYDGTAVEGTVNMAPTLSLAQNNPNPFKSGTMFNFNVPGSQNVKLAVYSVSGQLVKTLVNGMVSGSQSVRWDGTNSRSLKVNSGVYIYKLTAGSRSIVKRMIMMQ